MCACLKELANQRLKLAPYLTELHIKSVACDEKLSWGLKILREIGENTEHTPEECSQRIIQAGHVLQQLSSEITLQQGFVKLWISIQRLSSRMLLIDMKKPNLPEFDNLVQLVRDWLDSDMKQSDRVLKRQEVSLKMNELKKGFSEYMKKVLPLLNRRLEEIFHRDRRVMILKHTQLGANSCCPGVILELDASNGMATVQTSVAGVLRDVPLTDVETVGAFAGKKYPRGARVVTARFSDALKNGKHVVVLQPSTVDRDIAVVAAGRQKLEIHVLHLRSLTGDPDEAAASLENEAIVKAVLAEARIARATTSSPHQQQPTDREGEEEEEPMREASAAAPRPRDGADDDEEEKLRAKKLRRLEAAEEQR